MLQNGNWLLGVILYVIILIIIAIVILVINKFDKDKTAEEAMKIMK